MKFFDQPHRRFNALTNEWVLVSPHRTQRPWQGSVEQVSGAPRPEYDPNCYLCPGNTRAGGAVNPNYEDCFVFTNDFAALLPETPLAEEAQGLMRLRSVRGTSRVLCFSPRHDLSIPEMELAGIRSIIDRWAEQTEELGRDYRWVQIFENKGEMMGASNPHPHGQIWASDSIPNEPFKEDTSQRTYFETNGSSLLADYLEGELKTRERLVVENEHWAALVPFWAVWPFEILLLPKVRAARMNELNNDQRNSLADALKRLLGRYDDLFGISFPYTMGWHGAPFGDGVTEHWQLHAHFYPPLLRSATVKKFMVGYEMLAEAQRDITPEQAAKRLCELPERG